MTEPKAHISVDQLRTLLSYDPQTGLLTWKVKTGRMMPGSLAGGINRKGYGRVILNGKHLASHRIAWALAYGEWPMQLIDHRNGIRSDNRLTNLRIANDRQNSFNRRKSPGKTSSFRGVTWHRGCQKWQATICAAGKDFYLGLFDSEVGAAAAYNKAAIKHHGDFAALNDARPAA